jgi:hypothetical protein
MLDDIFKFNLLLYSFFGKAGLLRRPVRAPVPEIETKNTFRA